MFRIVATFAAFVMLVSVSGSLAAKPDSSGKLTATIAIQSQSSASITFAVTRSGGKANAAYSLWVANLCDDAGGVRVSAEYLPVQWDQNTSEFPTTGIAGAFTLGGAVSCAAYVWEFPDALTPLKNADLTYTP